MRRLRWSRQDHQVGDCVTGWREKGVAPKKKEVEGEKDKSSVTIAITPKAAIIILTTSHVTMVKVKESGGVRPRSKSRLTHHCNRCDRHLHWKFVSFESFGPQILFSQPLSGSLQSTWLLISFYDLALKSLHFPSSLMDGEGWRWELREGNSRNNLFIFSNFFSFHFLCCHGLFCNLGPPREQKCPVNRRGRGKGRLLFHLHDIWKRIQSVSFLWFLSTSNFFLSKGNTDNGERREIRRNGTLLIQQYQCEILFRSFQHDWIELTLLLQSNWWEESCQEAKEGENRVVHTDEFGSEFLEKNGIEVSLILLLLWRIIRSVLGVIDGENVHRSGKVPCTQWCAWISTIDNLSEGFLWNKTSKRLESSGETVCGIIGSRVLSSNIKLEKERLKGEIPNNFKEN